MYMYVNKVIISLLVKNKYNVGLVIRFRSNYCVCFIWKIFFMFKYILYLFVLGVNVEY